MLDEDPIVIILKLLKNNWDETNTALADPPRFSTGWYDRGSGDPQITISNSDEGVVNGGLSGHTGGTGSGGISQHRNGSMFVNCWSGTYETLEGAGTNGEDVSPKQASYDMAKEVHRIINSNASGTTNDAGERQLHSLAVTDTRRMVEDDVDPAIFRHECTVIYNYNVIYD